MHIEAAQCGPEDIVLHALFPPTYTPAVCLTNILNCPPAPICNVV